jgi:transposase
MQPTLKRRRSEPQRTITTGQPHEFCGKLLDNESMNTTVTVASLREKYKLLSATLTERLRRSWAAAEAMSLPRGGISLVAAATGLSRTTITAGIRELRQGTTERPLDSARCRRCGGGRHLLEVDDAMLLADWERLVDPCTRGDPMSPLRWTCKSTRQLAQTLQQQGHKVSHPTVAALLRELGYSLQVNRKTREGSSHPDRNAQFEFINNRVVAFQKAKQPVLSVDTKKKENLGI